MDVSVETIFIGLPDFVFFNTLLPVLKNSFRLFFYDKATYKKAGEIS
jgi:hypothetical protein